MLSAMVTLTEKRRSLLGEILDRREPATQAELITALRERGVPATQPSVSRDLRALGAVKQGGRYLLPEPDAVTPLESLSGLLRGIQAAGANLVVIACEPGAASAIARALDDRQLPGVVGTLAGDDTVFVAVSRRSDGRRVEELVRSQL